MKYSELLEQTSAQITEIMPWDFRAYLEENTDALVVDVREASEYQKLKIKRAISAPRGILESCCSWDFTETIPALASAQNRPVLLLCRSGHRSAFATLVLQQLGFEKITSLKLGLKGLNDEAYPIVNHLDERLDADLVEEWLNPAVLPEQLSPN